MIIKGNKIDRLSMFRRRYGTLKLIADVYELRTIRALVKEYGTNGWEIVAIDSKGKYEHCLCDLNKWWESMVAKYNVGDIVWFRLGSDYESTYKKGTIERVYVGGYRIVSEGAGYPVDERDVLTTTPKG